VIPELVPNAKGERGGRKVINKNERKRDTREITMRSKSGRLAREKASEREKDGILTFM